MYYTGWPNKVKPTSSTTQNTDQYSKSSTGKFAAHLQYSDQK